MMRGSVLVASLVLGGLAVTVRAEEQAPPLPPPLPMDQVIAAFAPGQGRNETATACGMCHAPIMVTGKKFDADKWAEVVDQMIDKGARVRDEDYDTIVNYLAAHYGAAP